MRNKLLFAALTTLISSSIAYRYMTSQTVPLVEDQAEVDLSSPASHKGTPNIDSLEKAAPTSVGSTIKRPDSGYLSSPETDQSAETRVMDKPNEDFVEQKPPHEIVEKLVYHTEKLHLPQGVLETHKYSVQDIKDLEQSVLNMPTETEFKKYPSLETSKELLRKVIGIYSGQAIWKNSGRSGEANLSIAGAVTEANFLEGSYEFSIFDEEELRTRFTVPGHIGGSIRVVDLEQSSIIIEPQGREGVQKLQLFLRGEVDRKYLIGNLYIANAKEPGKFERVAIVKMSAL